MNLEIFLYIQPYIFLKIFCPSHIMNTLKYVLFMRILTQDKITNEDIADSRILINRFVNDYERLYGSVKISFNFHTLTLA